MVTKIPNLEKFGIPKSLGLLSDEPPLKRFSNLYFDPWDKITATLPDDLRAGGRVKISVTIRGIDIHDPRVYMGRIFGWKAVGQDSITTYIAVSWLSVITWVYNLVKVLAAEDANPSFVIKALNDAADTFVRMGAHLPKLYSVLDANSFYHGLRPFFGAGSANEDTGLPRNRLPKSDRSELRVKCIAVTTRQGALFQFLDLVLGVEHEKPKGAKEIFVQNQELVDAHDNCMNQLHLCLPSALRDRQQDKLSTVKKEHENTDKGLGNDDGEGFAGLEDRH
ncbi:indoleamine 2,3-dioxygenase family protein [Metarhizium acridum CQMa 102]|uniref:Indoleamine 2,3-dioxygenase family protein n=1 Tax=Metarhizium acridum (strain CQMa 102) TaxID=655827 RepID=E9DXD9_METAQ|nr:indoleamine 2,3-dioxygenase family protein [Metarhizium acridum CQMa 102]EFY91697.1 indoleamine 2,3-dioxygenase family protein [Metarhizium acridum CQMa 102]